MELNKFQILWLERYYLLKKYREKLLLAIVWRLPRELVMWCYIRVAAYATTGKYRSTIVPELSMMGALNRWGRKVKKQNEITEESIC